MIHMFPVIKGTVPCHDANRPTRLAHRALRKALLNKLGQCLNQTPCHSPPQFQVKQPPLGEWLQEPGPLNHLLTSSCAITACRCPLALVLGMMSTIHLNVRAIIGTQNVRKKSMSSGNVSGKVCLSESKDAWMSGKTGCAIILRICPKRDKRMSLPCLYHQWLNAGIWQKP